MLESGQVFAARYRVLRLIAEDGTGALFEAVHIATDRRVVLELIVPRVVSAESARRELEAEISARVSGPSVVEILEAGFDEVTQSSFRVTELLDGQTLAAFVRSRGPLEVDEAAPLLERLAPALIAADARAPTPLPPVAIRATPLPARVAAPLPPPTPELAAAPPVTVPPARAPSLVARGIEPPETSSLPALAGERCATSARGRSRQRMASASTAAALLVSSLLWIAAGGRSASDANAGASVATAGGAILPVRAEALLLSPVPATTSKSAVVLGPDEPFTTTRTSDTPSPGKRPEAGLPGAPERAKPALGPAAPGSAAPAAETPVVPRRDTSGLPDDGR